MAISDLLDLSQPRLMGILNVTPDSFSDGGEFFDPASAIAFGRKLVKEGAYIVDVGGESTRPQAAPVPVKEELSRVLPVIRTLADEGIRISIDTRHPEVAEEAIKSGAMMVNDVSALADPEMRLICKLHNVPACIMHMRGNPTNMQETPQYEDVVQEVLEYLLAQAGQALAEGVPQVIIDPGIGFGKTVAHNCALLKHLDRLVSTGYPVMVGTSRKSFIFHLSGEPDPRHRLPGTIASSLWAIQSGVKLLRVHDVTAHCQALAVWKGITQDSCRAE